MTTNPPNELYRDREDLPKLEVEAFECDFKEVLKLRFGIDSIEGFSLEFQDCDGVRVLDLGGCVLDAENKRFVLF